MHFDSTLRERWSPSPMSSQSDGAAWRFDMPEGWMQGRSVFGGLSVAAAAGLASRHVDPSRSLRTLSAQLMRPVTAGPVDGSFRVVREGKSTTFTEVRLMQQGVETAIVSLIFTRPRDEALVIAPTPRWQGPDPESLDSFSDAPGPMTSPAASAKTRLPPEFVQHIAMRWASGGPPFSGASEARFTGYCRFRQPAGDVEGILGLLDAWPCPSLSVLETPTFGSTVTWTAHILAIPDDFDGWFPFSYDTVAGAGGFHTAVGRLHAPDGQLIGWTEQLVAIFA